MSGEHFYVFASDFFSANIPSTQLLKTKMCLFLKGDSGGPQVIKQGSFWIQAGIVSFGIGCALPDFPGVYARVSWYENWIKDQITSSQPGFIQFTGNNSDPSTSCTASSTTTIHTSVMEMSCFIYSINLFVHFMSSL